MSTSTIELKNNIRYGLWYELFTILDWNVSSELDVNFQAYSEIYVMDLINELSTELSNELKNEL